jgi:hypothetical protein
MRYLTFKRGKNDSIFLDGNEYRYDVERTLCEQQVASISQTVHKLKAILFRIRIPI